MKWICVRTHYSFLCMFRTANYGTYIYFSASAKNYKNQTRSTWRLSIDACLLTDEYMRTQKLRLEFLIREAPEQTRTRIGWYL